MEFVFNWGRHLGPAGMVLNAIAGSVVGIGLLLAFILGRRACRRHYFRRRNAQALVVRKKWQGIVSGTVPPESWRLDPLQREIVETMLLDSLEVASGAEASRLRDCLVSSALLDQRIHEARNLRGWRRRRVLVTLGRMRAPEAIPALAEGLADPNPENRLAAVRGLEQTALPEAAIRILDRVAAGGLPVPASPLQNALLSCCRSRPGLLVPYLRHAHESVRPLLARVLGELATPDLDDDLLLLAADPAAEVRASAARALAEAKPRIALPVLTQLAGDPEWFVRLRAVAGLGALENPSAIPVLIEALCDANRNVRQRASWALARMESHLEEILKRAMETHDRYALEALFSELERSGGIMRQVNALVDPVQRHAARAILLRALRAGMRKLLLDALVHHGNWRVRLAVARLLASSHDPDLAVPLEQLDAAARSPREERLIRGVLARLRGSGAASRCEKAEPALEIR